MKTKGETIDQVFAWIKECEASSENPWDNMFMIGAVVRHAREELMKRAACMRTVARWLQIEATQTSDKRTASVLLSAWHALVDNPKHSVTTPVSRYLSSRSPNA